VSTAGSVAGKAAGGWIGLVAGLATAAFTYYQISQASDMATSSLKAQTETLEELKRKYEAADSTEKTHLRNEAEKNYNEALKQRNKAIDRLPNAVNESDTIPSNKYTMAEMADLSDQIKQQLKDCLITEEEAIRKYKELRGIKPNSESAKALDELAYKLAGLRKDSVSFGKELGQYGKDVPIYETAEERQAIVAEGVKKINEAFQKLINSQEQSNALLERQKQLMAGGMSAKVAADVAKAESGGLKDKDELNKYTQSLLQQENLQKQIDNIKSVTDTLQSLGKSADEAKAELEGGKDGLTLFQLSMKDATSAQMEQAKQYIAQSKAYKEQLQNQQTLQGMTQQMQEAYAELAGGKSGLIAFRLGLTHATDEQIKQAQALNELTEQIQRQKSVMTTLSSLQEQVATLGMDTVQRQLYSLRKDGATPEQLRYAEAMLKQIKSFDEAQKDTRLAAKDLSSAAEALKDSSRADDSSKKLSIFSKEYRDQEEAYWKKKRQEESESNSPFVVSGRRPDAGINNFNFPKLPAAFGALGNGGADIYDKLQATETINVNLSNGGQNVGFKAMFYAPGGAVQFKDILKISTNSLANDSR